MPTISSKIVVAKKDYRCDFDGANCFRHINAGQKYLRAFGYGMEGDPPYAMRMCLRCGMNSQDPKNIKAMMAITISELNAMRLVK